MFFKKWYQNKIKKINKKLYNKGYNIAAGALLRGEKTPLSILTSINITNKSWNYFYDWSYFYEGSCNAVERLIDEGVIKDNRYHLEKTVH